MQACEHTQPADPRHQGASGGRPRWRHGGALAGAQQRTGGQAQHDRCDVAVRRQPFSRDSAQALRQRLEHLRRHQRGERQLLQRAQYLSPAGRRQRREQLIRLVGQTDTGNQPFSLLHGTGETEHGSPVDQFAACAVQHRAHFVLQRGGQRRQRQVADAGDRTSRQSAQPVVQRTRGAEGHLRSAAGLRQRCFGTHGGTLPSIN